jgi:hypothetical protein
MRSRDPRHRAVTERLRAFFGDLTTQLAAGTVEVWRNVEHRVVRATSNSDDAPPPYIGPLMQQQSVQQQQSKSQVEEDVEGPARDKKTNAVNTGE